MSADATVAHDVEQDVVHDQPTDRKFIHVAIILAVVTAIEVAWSYLPWGDGVAMTLLEVGGLLIMMAYKFFVVASIFMHLKFDNKVLTRLFYFGLILAVVVFVAVLTMFELFGDGAPYLHGFPDTFPGL